MILQDGKQQYWHPGTARLQGRSLSVEVLATMTATGE